MQAVSTVLHVHVAACITSPWHAKRQPMQQQGSPEIPHDAATSDRLASASDVYSLATGMLGLKITGIRFKLQSMGEGNFMSNDPRCHRVCCTMLRFELMGHSLHYHLLTINLMGSGELLMISQKMDFDKQVPTTFWLWGV